MKTHRMKMLIIGLVASAIGTGFFLVAQEPPRVTFGAETDDAVVLARFSPDSKTIVSSQKKDGLQLWNVADGKFIRQFKSADDRPTQEIRWIRFSEGGRILMASGVDRDLVLWEVETGKQIRAIPGGNKSWILAHAVTPDGTQLITVDGNSAIQRWDEKTGKILMKGEIRPDVSEPLYIGFAKDGKNFFIAEPYQTRVFDFETLKVRFGYYHGDQKPLKHLAIFGVILAPDGAGMIFCNREGKIVDLDFATGMERRAIDLKSSGIRTISMNAKGDRLLAGCTNGIVHLFSFPDGKLIKSISGYRYPQISPDGKTALTFTKNGRMMLWDLDK